MLNNTLHATPDVDWLSNVIREADGNHSLGAGALAEKIIEAMVSRNQQADAVCAFCEGTGFTKDEEGFDFPCPQRCAPPSPGSYLLEVERNAEGHCLAYLSKEGASTGMRIAGPKAWGGGRSLAKLQVSGRTLVDFITSEAGGVAYGVYEKVKKERGNASFQDRVRPWMGACFGPTISSDKKERNHRFFEESTETVQACGMTRSEAHQLVDYVYDRPVGEKHQEVGGVMVTLAALCMAQGLDMHECGEVELARIWTKVQQIRDKQARRPKCSPLPQHVESPLPFDYKTLLDTAKEKLGLDKDTAFGAAMDLYNEGLISYPRPDSRYLREEIRAEVFKNISQIVGDNAPEGFSLTNAHSAFDSSKVGCHEAVVPLKPYPDSETKHCVEKQVYDLIVQSVVGLFTPVGVHPDDRAVDRFADKIKAKLKYTREVKGRGGWQDPSFPAAQINGELIRHLAKGDPVDVAAYCMFLSERGEPTTSAYPDFLGRIQFPVMLRKMWTGGEVQEWLDSQGALFRIGSGNTEQAD